MGSRNQAGTMQDSMSGAIVYPGDAAYDMEPGDLTVHMVIVNTDRIVTLPPASKALIGVPYVIRALGVGTGDVIVTYPGGAEDSADLDITIDHGFVISISDGVNWYPLASLLT